MSETTPGGATRMTPDRTGASGEAAASPAQREIIAYVRLVRAGLADLAAEGVLHLGNRLVHESVVGTRFIGRILEETSAHGLEAIVPEVTGSAHRTGEHTFTVDRTDPLVPGFVLR